MIGDSDLLACMHARGLGGHTYGRAYIREGIHTGGHTYGPPIFCGQRLGLLQRYMSDRCEGGREGGRIKCFWLYNNPSFHISPALYAGLSTSNSASSFETTRACVTHVCTRSV